MAARIAVMLALALVATGCATSASLRTVPLREGEARVFRAPHPIILTATRQAFGESGLTIDSMETVDAATTMLLAHHGMNLITYGEIVRGMVSAEGSQTTVVRVITRSSNQMSLASRDLSGAVFAAIERILAGWDSSAVRRPQVRDSAFARVQSLALSSLGSGRAIRVSGATIGTITGTMFGVQNGRLVWATDPRPAPVTVLAIDTVWVRKSHSLVGAAVGAAIGMLAGVVIASQSPTTCPGGLNGLGQCLAESYATRMSALLIGMGAGTALGAITGAAIPSWERRWP